MRAARTYIHTSIKNDMQMPNTTTGDMEIEDRSNVNKMIRAQELFIQSVRAKIESNAQRSETYKTCRCERTVGIYRSSRDLDPARIADPPGPRESVREARTKSRVDRR